MKAWKWRQGTRRDHMQARNAGCWSLLIASRMLEGAHPPADGLANQFRRLSPPMRNVNLKTNNNIYKCRWKGPPFPHAHEMVRGIVDTFSRETNSHERSRLCLWSPSYRCGWAWAASWFRRDCVRVIGMALALRSCFFVSVALKRHLQ